MHYSLYSLEEQRQMQEKQDLQGCGQFILFFLMTAISLLICGLITGDRKACAFTAGAVLLIGTIVCLLSLHAVTQRRKERDKENDKQ